MTDFLSYLLRIGGHMGGVNSRFVLPIPALIQKKARDTRAAETTETEEAVEAEGRFSASAKNPEGVSGRAARKEASSLPHESFPGEAPVLFSRGTRGRVQNAILKKLRGQAKNEMEAMLLMEMRDGIFEEPSGVEELIKTFERGAGLPGYTQKTADSGYAPPYTPETGAQSGLRREERLAGGAIPQGMTSSLGVFRRWDMPVPAAPLSGESAREPFPGDPEALSKYFERDARRY